VRRPTTHSTGARIEWPSLYSAAIELDAVGRARLIRALGACSRYTKSKKENRVERLFAWLYNFRRVAMRFDRHEENYLGFVHLGCIKILLRCYL